MDSTASSIKERITEEPVSKNDSSGSSKVPSKARISSEFLLSKSRKKQQVEKDDFQKASKKRMNISTLPHISNVLVGKIFFGWVNERQWIDKLNGYRDIIEIDEWEENLNFILKNIVDSIPGVREEKKWINITAPSSASPCYRLWVLLKEIPLPGHYWFHVKEISTDEHFGLTLTIELLRLIHEFDGESLTQRKQRLQGDESADEWKDWIEILSNIQFMSIFKKALASLKPSYVAAVFRSIIMLTVLIIISLGKLMLEVNNFTLKLIQQFGIFIHHSTPLLQSILRFIEKIFGGIFLLIAMVYRDIRSPRHAPPSHFPPLPPASASDLPPQILPPPPLSHQPRFIRPNAWVSVQR